MYLLQAGNPDFASIQGSGFQINPRFAGLYLGTESSPVALSRGLAGRCNGSDNDAVIDPEFWFWHAFEPETKDWQGFSRAPSFAEYVPPLDIARVYIGLGDADRAFEWLDKAYEEHCRRLIWLNVHPMFRALKLDRRFVPLLKKLGLHRESIRRLV